MALRVRGTQDSVDMRLFDAVIQRIKQHLFVHNFSHIATPIIEPVSLFERTLNQASDIVHKEMFVLQNRSSDDQLLCLRPEATAPTARAFIDNRIQLVPWRVFSYGPMFRYERPQKGRYRQFNQCTIELIGAADSSHDVQLITLLDRLFDRVLGLEHYSLSINFLGSTEDRKMYGNALQAFLKAKSDAICKLCIERTDSNTLRVLDCKNPACQEMYQEAPALADFYGAESIKKWEAIQDQLQLLSVSYSIDPRLVRGLDYYNDTVFEFMSPALGAQATFCAGGRYDGLLSQIDPSQSQPSCGAAIGLERVLLLLEQARDHMITPPAPLHIILPLGAEEKSLALLVADELTNNDLTNEVLFDATSVKSGMRKASKLGASTVLMIGSHERERGTITVKNMVSGEQTTITQAEIVAFLQK